MRVAILILAYREPEVLRSAVAVYKEAGFDVFVHLDAKADMKYYINKMGDSAAQCHFVERRSWIYWGGYSMIEAELALISAALEQRFYDRFTLLSDDSYPLVGAAALVRHARDSHDQIMLAKLDDSDPFLFRYSRFFFLDHQASSIVGRQFETAAIDASFLYEMSRIQDIMACGKKQIDIYYGSQWWSITRESMLTILQCLEHDSHLVDSFRYSAVPDEILFQSLIGNYIPRGRVSDGPVFVEWNKDPRPYVFKSADELRQVDRKFAFARKFSGQAPEVFRELRRRFDMAEA